MVSGRFTKPNYNKKLENIEKEIQKIKILEEQLIQKKYNIYGSPDSPFYGLKTPSLPKIIEYMCDTYKLPYDLMMNVVYDNIMRKYFKIHLDNTFSNLKSPFEKSLEYVKSVNYDYPDDYKCDRYDCYSFKNLQSRSIWCERIIIR